MARRAFTPAEVEEGFRLKALVAVEGFLRMTGEAIARYGDLDTLVIYLTVVSAGGGRALRDPGAARLYGGPRPMPDGYFRPISRRAVAAATGLPRETVRRKIAWLLDQGWIVAEGRGVRATSDTLSQGENLAFARALVATFEATVDRLRRPLPGAS